MSSPNPNDALLLIRCPSCGQRFKVGEDLRDRTVECGGCEHRFRINDDVIVKSRKVYPGERPHDALNLFQRVPLASANRSIGVEPIRYGTAPDPAILEPISPQRILAGIIGATGIILMALLLMFGNSRGGMLDGMDLTRRLMMGGFAAVMGLGMLVYANPRARLKAILIGTLMSAGLMVIPFFFNTKPLDPSGMNKGDLSHGTGPPISVPEETDAVKITNALRIRIGTHPLDLEIERLAKERSGKHAIGLWLRGMSSHHRFLVRDYMVRVAKADPVSILYPRDDGDFLMVITGTAIDVQEMSVIAAPLGMIENIYQELFVIEVKVRNENFVEGPIEKLSNREDPAFYDLNKRELESIDMSRVEKAVQRLAEAEPKIYRVDIARKLGELLGDDAAEFKPNICRALSIWSDDPTKSGATALAEVKKSIVAGKVVIPEMVTLITNAKNLGIIPILDELWYKEPQAWESHYSDLGPAAEATLLKRLPETEGTVRHSAVRILAKVGGSASLPFLKAMAEPADSELKVLIEQAQKAIATRISE